jgi:TPR repeat protein
MFARRIAQVFLVAVCCSAPFAQAEVKEYVRDYNYHGTEFDTRDTSRVNAIDGVKRELLEELGTYVGSVVKMNQDSLGNSYMSHDVVNITAGIVAMKVLNEKWKQPEYYVKAGMKADPDDVLAKLKAMREDLELEKSLRDSYEELQRARDEVAQLKAQLAQLKLAQAVAVSMPVPTLAPAPVAAPAEQPVSAQLNAKVAQVELAKDVGVSKPATSPVTLPASPKKSDEIPAPVAPVPPAVAPVPVSVAKPASKTETDKLVMQYVKAVQGVEVEEALQRAMALRMKGDFTAMIKEMSTLADKGYARAQHKMGWIYERGLGVPQDYQKAKEWYTKAATNGDVDAIASIGWLYEHGWGVEKSYEKAAEHYQHAIDSGSTAGIARMGYLHETGKGVQLSKDKAAELYQLAIDKGNLHGQARLGLLYQLGEGVRKNERKAVVVYTHAIDHGYPLAMKRLSMMHIRGIGGASKDHDRAIALLREAIKYKLPATYAYMGFMYLNGYGVKQDYDEAKKYLEKGAEMDAPLAEFLLGRMYKDGRGVSQDKEKAKYWFDRAKSKGFDISNQIH